MTTPLRDLIKNPTPAELELVARYAMQPEDARRERAFTAFAGTGLPHRRMENWRWSDFKAQVKGVENPSEPSRHDPLEEGAAAVFRFTPTGFEYSAKLPAGLRMLAKPEAQAFGGAEDMPLGALAAALSGSKTRPATLMLEVTGSDLPRIHFAFDGEGEANFGRVVVLIRPGAALTVSESYTGGAGFSSVLFEYGLQDKAQLDRIVYQRGADDEAIAVTAAINLEESAEVRQTVLAFGAKIARIETRVTHQKENAKAVLNAAYLAGAGKHIDLTSHVRHGAQHCVTEQITKGAVLDGGTGVFQGKFHVPRKAGQYTNADMQHQALLLEQGAVVFAKPELEIYADDVECAHGNTCGALDENQLFYMRQRGIPEVQARALLTRAFVMEALDGAGMLGDILAHEVGAWLD